MLIERQQDVTPAVLQVMERTRDPRLREIMMSMVMHLHAFVRDVRLTEAEFREAAAILNEMGNSTSDTHNEMVLMAGSPRCLLPDVPAQQWRQRQYGDVSVPARSILAPELPTGSERGNNHTVCDPGASLLAIPN